MKKKANRPPPVQNCIPKLKGLYKDDCREEGGELYGLLFK